MWAKFTMTKDHMVITGRGKLKEGRGMSPFLHSKRLYHHETSIVIKTLILWLVFILSCPFIPAREMPTKKRASSTIMTQIGPTHSL